MLCALDDDLSGLHARDSGAVIETYERSTDISWFEVVLHPLNCKMHRRYGLVKGSLLSTSYRSGSNLLRMNNCLESILRLPLPLRLVELIKKPVIVTRPIRNKHFGKHVALAVGPDAKVACKSINVL